MIMYNHHRFDYYTLKRKRVNVAVKAKWPGNNLPIVKGQNFKLEHLQVAELTSSWSTCRHTVFIVGEMSTQTNSDIAL